MEENFENHRLQREVKIDTDQITSICASFHIILFFDTKHQPPGINDIVISIVKKVEIILGNYKLNCAISVRSQISSTMKFPISKISLVLGFLAIFTVSVTASKSPNTGTFRVVLDSPVGNDKKTRVMLKNKIQSSVADVDLQAMVERAKKEFKTISEKTKHIGEEAREIVDKFKDNLQHYSRKELGIYAALTVALTVTLKSKKARSRYPFLFISLLFDLNLN